MTRSNPADGHLVLINTFTVEPDRPAEYDAVLADPLAREHMTEASAVAQSFDPIVYELREVHDGPQA